MTKLNISEAARATGKNRTTLYRHIKSGKLSSEKDATDNPVIDVSELQRVYGDLKMSATDANATQNVAKHQIDTPKSNTELQLLRLKLEHFEEKLEAERVLRKEIEQQRDLALEEKVKLLEIVEKQTHMLAAPKENEPQKPVEKRGFWRRVFGG